VHMDLRAVGRLSLTDESSLDGSMLDTIAVVANNFTPAPPRTYVNSMVCITASLARKFRDRTLSLQCCTFGKCIECIGGLFASHWSRLCVIF
jgi:hypothetical protein